MGVTKKRVLQPKVTAASVKRQWEGKYAELNEKYERLCKAHIELAKKADEHRNREEQYGEELQDALDLATDRLVVIHQLQGVIIYLEGKLDGNEEA